MNLTPVISKPPRPFRRGCHLRAAVLMSWVSLPFVSEATPDHSVTVTEAFLGSNGHEYAVLRTENDNLGSYYRARVKIWLDVIPKNGTDDSKPGSTLIRDEIRTNPADGGKPFSETQFKDDKLSLSELAGRFEITNLTPWPSEWRKDLEFDPKTGRVMFQTQCLVEENSIKGSRFSQLPEGSEFELLNVAGDGDCLYLNVAMGVDAGRETRWICVSPVVSRNVLALRERQPIYLSAGSFKTDKEAFAKVAALRRDDPPYSRWEVWLVWHEEAKQTEYEVVLADSKSRINNMSMMSATEPFSIHLLPVTSEGFRERLAIPAAETSSR